jgi:hypothetical protein
VGLGGEHQVANLWWPQDLVEAVGFAIFEYGLAVSAGRGLPDWTPAFTDTVTDDARPGWKATKDGRDFSLRVPVNQDSRTVDYLRQIAPAARAASSGERCHDRAAEPSLS